MADRERPTFICSGYHGPVEPPLVAPFWRVLLRFLRPRGLIAEWRFALWERWHNAADDVRWNLKQRRRRIEPGDDNGEPRDA